MVGARPRQSNAAHDAGIDGKGVGSREGDPPGWVRWPRFSDNRLRCIQSLEEALG